MDGGEGSGVRGEEGDKMGGDRKDTYKEKTIIRRVTLLFPRRGNSVLVLSLVVKCRVYRLGGKGRGESLEYKIQKRGVGDGWGRGGGL